MGAVQILQAAGTIRRARRGDNMPATPKEFAGKAKAETAACAGQQDGAWARGRHAAVSPFYALWPCL
jgi:hypothetical protein